MSKKSHAGLFKAGHQLARGGARPGSGRKPDEFRVWIRGLVHHPKVRARLLKILTDAENAEEKITEQGVSVPVRASAAVYLKALELCWHYAEGKPVDRVIMETVNGDDKLKNAIDVTPEVNRAMEYLDANGKNIGD